VQTGLYENANVRALAAERRMQEFSAQTGGAVYVPKSADDLDSAFAQISADLAQQYILSYYPAQDKRDGKYHLIAIKVKTRPNARVRARKGFVVKSRDRV
jgi:VWFA-related protein